MSNVSRRVLGGTLIVNYTKVGPKDKNAQRNYVNEKELGNYQNSCSTTNLYILNILLKVNTK